MNKKRLLPEAIDKAEQEEIEYRKMANGDFPEVENYIEPEDLDPDPHIEHTCKVFEKSLQFTTVSSYQLNEIENLREDIAQKQRLLADRLRELNSQEMERKMTIDYLVENMPEKEWRCSPDCGFVGTKEKLIANASGCLCCPNCGGSGGLI